MGVRKAQVVSEGFIDALMIIFTFLTALFFFLIFNMSGCNAVKQNVQLNNSVFISAGNLVLTYVRTPVAVNGEKLNFASFVRLWMNNRNSFESDLVLKTKEFLDFMSNNDCVEMRFYDVNNKELLVVESSHCDKISWYYKMSCSSIVLPSKNYNEFVRVEACKPYSKEDVGAAVP